MKHRVSKSQMRKVRTSVMSVVMAMVLNGVGPERTSAEIVKAYCTLTWEEQRPMEQGDCDFRQAFGNVQILMGKRWIFDFPDSERGKSYERDNQETGISFKRKGEYTIKIYQTRKASDN